jgi:hypothetical protein
MNATSARRRDQRLTVLALLLVAWHPVAALDCSDACILQRKACLRAAQAGKLACKLECQVTAADVPACLSTCANAFNAAKNECVADHAGCLGLCPPTPPPGSCTAADIEGCSAGLVACSGTAAAMAKTCRRGCKTAPERYVGMAACAVEAGDRAADCEASFLACLASCATPSCGLDFSPSGCLDVTDAAHGALCDGVTDDTAAIQAAVNAAQPGDTVYVPATGGNFCRTTGSITVDESITVRGAGPWLVSEIRRTDTYPTTGDHAGGAILYVISSGVRVDGLTLTGAEYGDVNVRNTHGVWAIGGPDAHLSNITVRRCTASKFRGRGISLEYVDDFIIRENHVEDAGYIGITASQARRGVIRGNTVIDINDPEVCPSNPFNPKVCQYENGYGIVVGGCGTAVCSEDIIIADNEVRENELWVGIMNHGGQRVLVIDNDVRDTNFLYANTVSEDMSGGPQDASHETWFVNNFGDILPISSGGRYDLPSPGSGEGLWLISFPSPVTMDLAAIGNIFRNTGNAGSQSGVFVQPFDGARLTWNVFESDPSTLPPHHGFGIFDRDGAPHANAVIAHNQIEARFSGVYSTGPAVSQILVTGNTLTEASYAAWITAGGTWDIHGNQGSGISEITGSYTPVTISQMPPAVVPVFKGVLTGEAGAVRLYWCYLTAADGPHDSFYIETAALPDSPWERLAYRPPHDPKWSFNAANSAWTPLDTLSHTLRGLSPGTHRFRIRANNGSEYSGWSADAQITVP